MSIRLASIYHAIAKDLGQLESFYFLCTLICDRLVTSNEIPLVKEFLKNIQRVSFEDRMPEFGYYLNMRFCIHQTDTMQALLNANIFTSIVCKKNKLSDKTQYLFAKDLILLLTSLGVAQSNIKTCQFLLNNLPLDAYQKNSIAITYFTARLNSGDLEIENEVLSHLNDYITDIEQTGVDLGLAYLSMLLTLQRVSGNTLLNPFINRIKHTIGERSNDVEIISVGSEKTKSALIDILVSLHGITNKEDLEFSIKRCIGIAHRLFEYSTVTGDIDGFLLSMAVKTDYSISKIQMVANQRLNEPERQLRDKLHTYSSHIAATFDLVEDQSCIWLGDDGDKQYMLTLTKSGYSKITELNTCNPFKILEQYNNIKNQLTFDDVRRIRNGESTRIVPIFPEEQEAQLLDLEKELRVATLPTPPGNILIIKDLNFTFFPHNLFINSESNELIFRHQSITNIWGSEWFSKSQTTTYKLNISAWLPVEDGDFAINAVASKLDETMSKFNIATFTDRIPRKPLASNINIILAHGADNISRFFSLSTNEQITILAIDHMIGFGKLAILFVCHSGSMAISNFGHKPDSFVRSYFENGYAAVIAPSWPLDIRIPPIWLPEFLNHINNGMTVSNAMLLAGQTVYRTYKHPAAWANLHLYGNPNIKFSN